MSLEPLPLIDAELALDRDWLPAAAAGALFDTLRATVSWEVHRIRLFGREVDSPRLSCWIGDPDATYRYSGALFEPRPWLPALLAVRDRLQRETGAPFNSVLANVARFWLEPAVLWNVPDSSVTVRAAVVPALL